MTLRKFRCFIVSPREAQTLVRSHFNKQMILDVVVYICKAGESLHVQGLLHSEFQASQDSPVSNKEINISKLHTLVGTLVILAFRRLRQKGKFEASQR